MFLPHLLRRTETTTTTATVEPPTVPDEPIETTAEVPENTSKRFSVSRMNHENGNLEPVVFTVGETVDVYFGTDSLQRGTLKRVNAKQARVEFPPTEPGGRVCSMLFDFGRIYKPKPQPEPEPTEYKTGSIPARWRELKTNHPETVLLFRVGDWFELFGDDATNGARVLGLTITNRVDGSGSLPMAGFQVARLDSSLSALVRAGFRVAICEPEKPQPAIEPEPKRRACLPNFGDIARTESGDVGLLVNGTGFDSDLVNLLNANGETFQHNWQDLERVARCGEQYAIGFTETAERMQKQRTEPSNPEPPADELSAKQLQAIRKKIASYHTEPTEPETKPEPETDSTIPDIWQHENHVQTFGLSLQENQRAELGGFLYAIEPNGTAWQFTRTQPDGTTETIVSGRYGFAFDSFARVVGYCVQDIRRRYVIEPEELPNGCQIESRFHKKRQSIVYVVLHPEPLGAKFRNEETRAKRFGGWYAREYKPEYVPGGFMFPKLQDAQEFANGFKSSANVNRSETSKPREPKPATARPGSGDPNKKQADKFRAMADSLEKTIAHESRAMTQNPTHKRLREYAHRMHTAKNFENTRDALRALADCLDSENPVVPRWLRELKTKTAIHELVSMRWDSSRDCSTDEFHKNTEPAVAVQSVLALWRTNNRAGASPEERERRELERETLELSQKNIPGFYQTPRAVVARMISLSDIEPGQTILEPSAGAGAIADGIRETFGDTVSVECWEPCGALRSILEKKRHNLRGFYFEECDTKNERFDRVLMNPPFEKNLDAQHVRRAFAALKPGGRLVAIVGAGSGFAKLSDLVSEFGELDEPLPAGTFNTVESINTTNVSARLIVLQKRENE